MKRIFILISLILMMVMTAGCQLMPPGEVVKASGGPYPANYRQMIKGYLKYDLYNPASLKDFTIIRSPTRITVNTSYPFIPIFEGQKVWECLVTYNAKDMSGQYVGQRLHVVWIRFDRIVAYDYHGIDLAYVIGNDFSSQPPKDKKG